MNKAIKAALLSALVFPGAGQFYLKRYWRGLLMMLITIVGLAVIIIKATTAALDRLQALQGTGTAFDINAISSLAEQSSANMLSDNTIILVFLVACWIFSVLDAYRIGRTSLPDGGAGK